MRIAPGAVIGANGQKPGIFTLAAGIGLQRHRGKPGHIRQPAFQPSDHRQITPRLIRRGKGMDIGKTGEGDGDHLRRRIQLHGAGTQRNHAPVQRHILVFQPLDITQHGMFGVVRIEHLSRQNGRMPRQRLRNPPGHSAQRHTTQNAGQLRQFLPRHRLIQRHRHRAFKPAQVETGGKCGRHHRIGMRAGLEHHRVKKRRMPMRKPRGTGQQPRLQSHPAGNAPQPLRPMPNRIHAGHHRQQHLRGADIRCRLFPPDMLLAGLQRQAHGRRAGGIKRDPHQPPRQQPLQAILHRNKRSMRPAITQRHAKALRGADNDIRAHLPRRRQQHQRQRVRRHNRNGAMLGGHGNLRRQVTQFTRRARILQQNGKGLFRHNGLSHGSHLGHHHPKPHRLSPHPHHRQRLRMQISRHHQRGRFALMRGMRHGHRLGRRGALIQKAGIGHRQPGQAGYHGLEIDQRLQPPLGNLRLIGRIGGVPARIFQNIAQDDRRRMGAVIPQPDQ